MCNEWRWKSNLIRLSKFLVKMPQNQMSNKTSFLRPVLKLHEFWNWEWTLERDSVSITYKIIRVIRIPWVKGSYHTYEKCVKQNPIPTLIYPKSWHQMVAGRRARSQPFSKCCCLLAGSFLLLVTCSVCQKKKETNETKEEGNGSFIHWRDDVHFFTTAS